MAIQDEFLYREDLPVNLRISGLSGKIRTSEDYNQVLDALLKNTEGDLEYLAKQAAAQRQEYLASPIGQKYPDAPSAAGSIAYPEVRAQRAANYKNYVLNKLKEAGIDRPQPSPLEEGRNPKPVTPQPVQEPLKPSYSSIEVATPKETESKPNESKLTSPESYLSNFIDSLGKEEAASEETLVAGPGYIDEDDAFDNPYYTDPVPDLDDDSDFPDLGDLGLAQATQSNFQELLNQPSQQETAFAPAIPLIPPAVQAVGAAAAGVGLLGASGALDDLGQNFQNLLAPDANVQEVQPADNVMGIFGLGKPKPGTPSKVRYPTKSPEDKLLEDLDKANEALQRQPRDTFPKGAEGKKRFPVGDQASAGPTNEQRIAAFRESLLAQAKDESPRTRRGPRGERATFSPMDRRRPDDKPFAQEERKPVKEETRQTFDVQEKRLARASKDDYRRKQADPIDPMRRGAIFG
tara:strand:- start:662 stop:2050 length:1389 start_codon:yes stop_codon:yes gene_type:complete